MLRGTRESHWLVIRRCLAIIRRVQRGPARWEELLQEIVATLSDPQHLERVVAGLNDEERAALRQVLASGGSMPWQDFEARYGSDLEESPYWEWHAPETTMGRLRGRGLLAETTVDGELRVVVPVELREIGD